MANKLTDQEILKLVEDFEKLSSDKKLDKHMGSGAFKNTYDVHPEYVLKEPHTNDRHSQRQMFEDYMSSKETGRHLPVEQPMLVLREGKSPIHIQKKLKSTEPGANNYFDLNDKADELKKILKDKGIDPVFSDISGPNIGTDESGIAKILDPMGPIYPDSNPRAMPAFKSKQNALKRLSQMGGTKIYRALPLIGPALGAYAALESGDASAAIPLLEEAESVGESPEEESMMLAEDKARKDYKQSPARFSKLQALARLSQK